jgi:hypothetical protein
MRTWHVPEKHEIRNPNDDRNSKHEGQMSQQADSILSDFVLRASCFGFPPQAA